MLSAHVLSTLDDRARVQVRGGYESLADIEDELIELVRYDPDTEEAFAADPGAATDVVRSILSRHVDEHAREEAAFPEVTDPDRLTRAFAELDRDGIVARENVGYDMSDVRQELWELTTGRRDARGWVAFHGQDLERVVDGHPLYLAFAHRSDRDEDFVTIGREVCDRLAAAGFTVEWNGTADGRIELHGVRWQRRRPADPGARVDPGSSPTVDAPGADAPRGLLARAARRLRGAG